MANAETQKIIELIQATHGKELEVTSYLDALEQRVFSVGMRSALHSDLYGFAEDYLEHVAIEKAYSEFTERSVLLAFSSELNLPNSNGMAAHINFELAQSAAVEELIERDVFLTMWLAKRPPYWLNESEILISESAVRLSEMGKTHKIECKFGLVGICNGHFVFCVATQGQDFSEKYGFTVSTAASLDFKTALEKASLCARRTINGFVTLLQLKKTIFANKKQIESDFPLYHRNYYMMFSSFAKASWFLESRADALELPSIDIAVRELPMPFVPAIPRVVVIATSAQAQQLWFGRTYSSLINFERLESVLENSRLTFNKYLHPIA